MQLRAPARVGRLTTSGRRRGWVIALGLAAAAIVVWAVLTGLGLLLTHVFATGPVHRADLGVDVWFARHRSPGWTSVLEFGTSMATTQTVIAVAAAAALLLRWRLGRWQESLLVITAVAGEVLLFLAVSAMVPQRRPPVPRLEAAPPTSSYPSGHTAAAVALYGGLGVLALIRAGRPWLRALTTVLFCIPVFVAISRLYEGEHYPSDVIAGALLAGLWLACVFRALAPRRAGPEAGVRSAARPVRPARR